VCLIQQCQNRVGFERGFGELPVAMDSTLVGKKNGDFDEDGFILIHQRNVIFVDGRSHSAVPDFGAIGASDLVKEVTSAMDANGAAVSFGLSARSNGAMI